MITILLTSRASVVFDKKFDSIEEILEHLKGLTTRDDEERFFLAVSRSDVLGSALRGIDRIAFSPVKLFEVLNFQLCGFA